MFEINDRTSLPYSAICYIRCDWADGTSTRASAVVIGVNDVLTALHAVYDAMRGGWAKAISITPAADTSPYFVAPFGTFTDVGTVDGRAPNWDLDGDGLLSAQESEGDLALIGMRSRIGDVTGTLPVEQMPNDFSGLMTGYPARGTGLMGENVTATISPYAAVYDVHASLGAGASGGPLLDTHDGTTYVTGVLSGGSTTESTYSGLFSAATWSWLQTKMAANDALLGLSPASGSNYTGTAFADRLTGGPADETFYGRGGNDTIAGGGGLDYALYDGQRSDYTVQLTGFQSFIVRDGVPSRDGEDTLTNVERLKFSDMYLAFDTGGHAGQAYRLYQAAFDREPDLPGLGFHIHDMDSGVPLWSVAIHFAESPEFRQKYAGLTDRQYVEQLYLNVLHRGGEQAGIDYHVNDLAHGFTKADVLMQFSESPENQANLIGTIQGGMEYVL